MRVAFRKKVLFFIRCGYLVGFSLRIDCFFVCASGRLIIVVFILFCIFGNVLCCVWMFSLVSNLVKFVFLMFLMTICGGILVGVCLVGII